MCWCVVGFGKMLARTKQKMIKSAKINRTLFNVIFLNHFVHAVFITISANRFKTLSHIPLMRLKHGMCEGSPGITALSACAACC